MMKTSLIVILLASLLVSCQQAQPTESDLVNKRQQQLRLQNNMTYTNIKSYTFVVGRFDDFILKPSTDHEYKFEMHSYWKQENVYVSAEYRQGEEIRVIIYENNERVLLDREFFMTTGFSIQGIKGSFYTVRFLAAGRILKLVSMIISSPMLVGDQVATKQNVNMAQHNMQNINNQFKALLTISQRNFIMQEHMSNKILTNTKYYLAYEVVEVILIIAVAIMQVTSITRLLKGGSIV